MLISADRFDHTPVMSLQTGSELARTSRAIIDPRNLSVVAYELEGPLLDQVPSLLRIADIREIGPLGMIIDSADELVAPSDVIRLREIYEIDFRLIGLPVQEERGKTIGKVIGYTLEAGNFFIQQLRVRRPFLKSFGDTELLIHRRQIVTVTDDHIIVKNTTITAPDSVAPELRPYENPFRKTPPAEAKRTANS